MGAGNGGAKKDGSIWPTRASDLTALLRDGLGSRLPAFLDAQRWYGDKGRSITSVSIVDASGSAGPDEPFTLAIVDVKFDDDGNDSRYFLPIALIDDVPKGAISLCDMDVAGSRRFAVDAFGASAFAPWLLRQLVEGAQLSGERGVFRWTRTSGLDRFLAAARAGTARTAAVEQSNSAVLYGDSIFLKVFRRLGAGVNPDEEVSSYLTRHSAFRSLPEPLGFATYEGDNGTSFSTAFYQHFVPSVGDGWSYTLGQVAAILPEDDDAAQSKQEVASLVATYAGEAWRLGARTGQLHQALGQESNDPAFRPEVVTEDDAMAREAEVLQALEATDVLLRARSAGLPMPLEERAAAFSAGLPAMARRAAGFRAEVGTLRTRVHGDYHLGQVLRTGTKDWVILDFEGEPARPIEERRRKTSPLKDVAGMLRSFGYAAGAVARERRLAPGSASAGVLAAWEAAARDAFLAGYRAQVATDTRFLTPTGSREFASAVAAWELEKALYEIGYELNNRPDWLSLPLDSLLGGPASDNSIREGDQALEDVAIDPSDPWRSAKER